MARTEGSFSLAGTLEPLVAAPLDARATVKLKTDLTAAATFDYTYLGMQTFVEEEQKRYTLIGADPTVLSNWREDGTAADSTIFQYGGSVAFASLPSPSSNRVGYVYDVTDAFTTTSDFVEGSGHNYPAHTDVAIVNIGDDQSPSYKYDVYVGNLEGYQTKMQVTALPTASATEEGHIYQYIGTTTSTYTNGYYYQCIEDPESAGSYIWTAKSVMEGGDSELDAAISVTKTVGGINSGTTISQGTSFETIFRNMLNPVENPTLTNPSASISATGVKLLEKGATLSTTITTTFNRGSITPAYGTSGYRSGVALDYALNGGSAQASNIFETTVVETSNDSFTVVVNYAQGEQPKNSIGEDYSSPLAAGSATSNTISYEFVNAIWSNSASISSIAKDALVSKSTGTKTFTFPAATVANPEVFDIPASWTVSTIKVLNTLSNQWEDCAREYTVTDTTHDDAGGTSTAYKRYTCNLGYAMGSRQIKITWT